MEVSRFFGGVGEGVFFLRDWFYGVSGNGCSNVVSGLMFILDSFLV